MRAKSILLKLWAWALLLVLSASCIDPFNPDTTDAPANYLVVDGFINSRGVTSIKLSRTVAVQNAAAPPAEARAQVFVEEEGGARYACLESGSTPGTYTSASLALNATRRHRLYIRTAAGREYRSAFVETKITPEIDEVSWQADSRGVQLYVNTQDPANNTRYYRWDYEETWQFRSAYRSFFEFVGQNVQRRSQDIHECWGNEKSAAIKLSNTVRLSQDVVADYPLTLLPPNAPKLRYRYSILVKQYAQTQAEYEYWDALKKNTENIGSLFDPLPSQLTGNVQSLTEPAEPVIGFVGAYSVAEKRIFIDRSELPAAWTLLTGYEGCRREPFQVLLPDALLYRGNLNYLPVDGVYSDAGAIIGYSFSEAECVDCRLQGTTVRPAFWR